MKITKTDYEKLQEHIANAVVRTGETPATYKARGFTETRYRWDMLWASKYPVNSLYQAGLNDDHIDTALRKAVKEIFG